MRMKTPCLGACSGFLMKILAAHTHSLNTPGAQVPVREQPWTQYTEKEHTKQVVKTRFYFD